MKNTIVFIAGIIITVIIIMLCIVSIMSCQGGAAPKITRHIPETFILINGGTFLMGSPENELSRHDDESPQRLVTVDSFYMSRYEVTQAEYEAIMGTNPSYFNGADLPAEKVSWFDAIEYCNRRSKLERLTPAYKIKGTNIEWNRKANGYRLPTEAEWEYACRAGTTTPFNTGNNITTDQANYNGSLSYNNNTEGEYRGRTMPVGSFPPNAWGLYDMHGNVREWCWDLYEEYPGSESPSNILLGEGGRISRGGSWRYSAAAIRSAYRGFDYPEILFSDNGFRLVRSF